MTVNTLKNFLENGVAEGALSENGILTVTADGNTVLKDLGELPVATDMGTLGTLVCIFGGVGLSILILKNV